MAKRRMKQAKDGSGRERKVKREVKPMQGKEAFKTLPKKPGSDAGTIPFRPGSTNKNMGQTKSKKFQKLYGTRI